jgi:hypothetical protein
MVVGTTRRKVWTFVDILVINSLRRKRECEGRLLGVAGNFNMKRVG